MRHPGRAASACAYPALTAADITAVARDLGLSPPRPVDPDTSAERLNHAIRQYLDGGLSLPAKERLAADLEASAIRYQRATLHADDRRQARTLRDLRSLLRQPGAAELLGASAIDSALHDAPREKAIESVRSAASEHRHRLDREQRRVVGDDGWPVYTGSKPRHRPQERAWRSLAEILLDEVWPHHSGREPTVTVDSVGRPAARTSAAADFGARLLEICSERLADDTAAHALRGHGPRLLAFIEERQRQRRR